MRDGIGGTKSANRRQTKQLNSHRRRTRNQALKKLRDKRDRFRATRNGAAEGLQFKPYGINEDGIGANSYFYHYTNKNGERSSIVIDFGHLLGGDEDGKYTRILPNNVKDLRDLEKAKHAAGFITHSHEDHTGMGPHLDTLGFRFGSRTDGSGNYVSGVPLYATKHARETMIVQYIMTGQKPSTWPDFNDNLNNNSHLDPRGVTQVGDLRVESVRVGHSTVARGFYVEAPNGVGFLHTGDMRMTKDDRHDNTTDMAHIKDIIARGKLKYLVADCTHWSVKSQDPSMEEAVANIGRVLRENKNKRLVIGMMSSSEPLIGAYMREAIEQGKTVILPGGTMGMRYKAAKKAGFDFTGGFDNEINPKTGFPYIVDAKSDYAAKIPPQDTVYITTGSSLDPNSKAMRFLLGQEKTKMPPADPNLDMVIGSRPPYPSMEQAWADMRAGIDKLSQRGYPVLLHGDKDSEVGRTLLKEFPKLQLESISNGGHMKEGDAVSFLTQVKDFAREAGVEPPVIIPHHADREKMQAAERLVESVGLKSHICGGQETVSLGKDGVKEVAAKPASGLEYIGVEQVEGSSKFPFGGRFGYDLLVAKENGGFEIKERIAETPKPEMIIDSHDQTRPKNKKQQKMDIPRLQKVAGLDQRISTYGTPKAPTREMLALQTIKKPGR